MEDEGRPRRAHSLCVGLHEKRRLKRADWGIVQAGQSLGVIELLLSTIIEQMMKEARRNGASAELLCRIERGKCGSPEDFDDEAAEYEGCA